MSTKEEILSKREAFLLDYGIDIAELCAKRRWIYYEVGTLSLLTFSSLVATFYGCSGFLAKIFSHEENVPLYVGAFSPIFSIFSSVCALMIFRLVKKPKNQVILCWILYSISFLVTFAIKQFDFNSSSIKDYILLSAIFVQFTVSLLIFHFTEILVYCVYYFGKEEGEQKGKSRWVIAFMITIGTIISLLCSWQPLIKAMLDLAICILLAAFLYKVSFKNNLIQLSEKV